MIGIRHIKIADHNCFSLEREEIVVPAIHLKREDGQEYECRFARFEATGATQGAAESNLMAKVSARLFSVALFAAGNPPL